MPALRMIRLLNSLETGTTTGAQLQTLLADTGRQGELTALLNLRSQTKRLVASVPAMTAVAASNIAMGIVAGNATAMGVVAGNATAMGIVLSATNNVGKALNQIVVNNGGTTNTTLAGLATMTDVAGNAAAMGIVAGNATAMGIVAGNATALTALNASDTAMNAIYASALVTKVNYSSAQIWSSTATLRSGAGLFVRLTSKGGQAGWGEGSTANEWMVYDGSNSAYAERAANPYNHTGQTSSPRHPLRKFNSSLGIRPYMAVEIAYIAM